MVSSKCQSLEQVCVGGWSEEKSPEVMSLRDVLDCLDLYDPCHILKVQHADKNCPATFTAHDLLLHFEQYGIVEKIWLVHAKPRRKWKRTGLAFVAMRCLESMSTALGDEHRITGNLFAVSPFLARSQSSTCSDDSSTCSHEGMKSSTETPSASDIADVPHVVSDRWADIMDEEDADNSPEFDVEAALSLFRADRTSVSACTRSVVVTGDIRSPALANPWWLE